MSGLGAGRGGDIGPSVIPLARLRPAGLPGGMAHAAHRRPGRRTWWRNRRGLPRMGRCLVRRRSARPLGVHRAASGGAEHAKRGLARVDEPAGVEGVPRRVGVPAQALTLPPPPSEPPDEAGLIAVAAGYGVEIVGPP